MLYYVRLLFDILISRKQPQEVPYSLFLLGILILLDAAYRSMGYMLLSSINLPDNPIKFKYALGFIESFGLALASIVVFFVCLYIFLGMFKLSGRAVQLASAILGVNLIFSLISQLVLMLVPQANLLAIVILAAINIRLMARGFDLNLFLATLFTILFYIIVLILFVSMFFKSYLEIPVI